MRTDYNTYILISTIRKVITTKSTQEAQRKTKTMQIMAKTLTTGSLTRRMTIRTTKKLKSMPTKLIRTMTRKTKLLRSMRRKIRRKMIRK